MFAGDVAPRNWALCNGQLLDVSDNIALYSIIGSTYGGDGFNTFGLPDLRGRCPVGLGSMDYIGRMGGLEFSYLTNYNLPAHSHIASNHLTGTLRCSDNLADYPSPMGNTLGKFKDNMDVYNAHPPDADMHENTAAIDGSVQIESTGGNALLENMQPSLTVNYIICVLGRYPSRRKPVSG
jgi:microcystin-dependent protein